MRARGIVIALLAGLLCVPALTPRACAQTEYPGGAYINPFPEGDVYRLQAFGDAFADGLLNGLAEGFAGDTRVDLVRKARTIPGLLRPEFEEEMRVQEAAREPLHVAIVMVGIWDRIVLRLPNGRRAVVNSAEWREEYGRRVDRLLKALRRRNVSIYWVGQPIMRRPDLNDDVQVMNDVVRQKAYLNGVKYIDIQQQFADENGQFSQYGPDLTGKKVLLREADGITFTPAGNRMLAHYLEQELKRDLLQARSERDVPLAGSELEQRRVAALRPRAPQPQQPADSSWKGVVVPGKEDKAQRGAQVAIDQSIEQRADNGRVTLRTTGPDGRVETVTLDLVRPAIPAAVVALLTRKDTGERASQMGDVVADEISGGLVVLSSVTPAGQAAAPGLPRRLPASQTPYYAVLVKGDRLPPKPGRADDFAWPRAEAEYGFATPAAAAQQQQANPAQTQQRRPQQPRPATR